MYLLQRQYEGMGGAGVLETEDIGDRKCIAGEEMVAGTLYD